MNFTTVAIDDCPYPGTMTNAEWEGSLRSARVVVPIVMKLISPASVLDVGCAWGSWLKAFEENGVHIVQGIDGPWVDGSNLLIDKSNLRTVDLAESLEIGSRFDLAVCLEVAEHLPEHSGPGLIRTLTQAAPLVLFSAAIPGQGGYRHLNEQWPDYWASLFETHGFRRLDPIRRHVWQDTRVEWWYRQNICLFAGSDAIARSAALQAEAQFDAPALEWINKEILEETYGRAEARYEDLRLHCDARYEDLWNRYCHLTTLRGMLKALPKVAWRAIQRRLSLAETRTIER